MEQYESSSLVQLEVSILPVINYALQQNRISMIRKLLIENLGAEPLENVELTVVTVPQIMKPLTRHIDVLPANCTVDIKDLVPILDGEYLVSLTEKVNGSVSVSLRQGENTIASQQLEVVVLAYDEWHGPQHHPELLAAFVTPNHPEVVKINAQAACFLEKWTGDPSLDAYQTQNVNRVLAQAAAIYAALQEQNIVYAVAPASFEKSGQRVRLCDAVMQQKMGTCLDLTLLYAGCLEAAGLHPLLILKEGHVFAGVWLEDLSFPEAVQDDVSRITKRLASGVNELAVVECTAFTAGKNTDFDGARAAAQQQLIGEDTMEYAIDVNRARLMGVSPLPIRIQTEQGWRIQRDTPDGDQITSAPKSLGETVAVEEGTTLQPFSRQVMWERKLLDLGLRNQLINMRLSKTVLPVMSGSMDELENALSDGSDFSILPKPADWENAEKNITFDTLCDIGKYRELLQSEFKNRRIRSVYTEGELAGVIKNLYRSAKSSLEENGANTLYLALGMLRWYETTRSSKARYAPVVLIPVEIVRKSALQGYIIRLRDDEPQMNITMLEKLKQDFGIQISGLDPLPQDEHGVDIRAVFTVLRKAVMDQPRWDVLEAACIGIFSFSQFVMWNDIRNRAEDLQKNKLVRSLMDGKLAWEGSDMEVGEKVAEDGVFLPLPADASQLFAIEAASKGESFVLHGPPGTGKSQTITALIANALAQGKSVLFVAEKMAALEVVQKRLNKIGLGPFCLELHSNKSKKRDVLEQLRQATEVTKLETAEQYALKAEQIAGLRKELDLYAEELHAKRGCGMTLYEMISRYEAAKEAPELSRFAQSYTAGLSAEDLIAQRTVAERLVAAAKAVGHPAGHPLEAVGQTQYSQSLRIRLPEAVAAYRTELLNLKSALKEFASVTGQQNCATYDAVSRLVSLAEESQKWRSWPRRWAKTEAPGRYFRGVSEMAGHCLEGKRLHQELSERWEETFFRLDGDELLNRYREISAKWFLPKLFGINGLMKQLKGHAKGAVDKDLLETDLQMLCGFRTERSAAETGFREYGDDLGDWYCKEDTDWQQIAHAAEAAAESAQNLFALTDADAFRLQYAGSRQIAQQESTLMEAWSACRKSQDALDALLMTKTQQEAEDWIAARLLLCDRIEDHADSLKEWISWNGICAEAELAGIRNVVEGCRNGLALDEVLPAYEKAIFLALATCAIDDSKALNSFSGAVFSEKVDQLKRIDSELTELTKQEIYCRLAAKVPNFAKEAAASSELGILQRAIRSGGRGVSIRKLFEQIPNLLPRLCPCMLMSPISAAQYLNPCREPFSMVVFDEASQLPTCKAVGALARGENAVVVGDPKQMPPTSFFSTNAVDEDNLDAEDLESILDDCLALNMPQSHLLWHYRSRHESLIAFSNSQFYENKLYTFPSVNDRETKVRLIRVDGVFERGKLRQNRAEAEAVIAELKRRSQDPVLSKLSVGVVTFNINQQNLIDDLLTEACAGDPGLEAWITGGEESLFVKNLENVQGDERDVILFSVGYGPDKDGKVYMNFGPLNRDGGWRRLNVAVSRSRHEMVVFSTLTPEQIDLSRTGAQGVAALKAFLEYADTGKLPVELVSGQKKTGRDGIADAICARLKEEGFDTVQSVGHSAYKLDIGVVDPGDPQRYILGILLDGPIYGQAKTTRDREFAQIGVLNGLGWRILRVWSMDWWDNSEKELTRILTELQRTPKDEEPKPEAVAAPAGSITETVAVAKEKTVEYTLYTPAKLRPLSVTTDDFMMNRYTSSIQSRVKQVVEQEAPISEALLQKRVLQSYGISRAGSRVQERLDAVIAGMGLLTTEQDGQRFFWKEAPETYSAFRVSASPETRRDARELPVQETVNAVCRVLYDQISLNEEDLIRETAKLMGYSRMVGNVPAVFATAVGSAQERGFVQKDPNGKWILTETGSARAAET